MSSVRIHPSKLKGKIAIPPSKSHTLRALVFSFLAKGESRISHYLESLDTEAMIRGIRSLGAEVEVAKECIRVIGTNGKPKPANDVIDCGNSGLVLRFLGALSALTSSYTIFTGDHSIRHNRPVKPLLDALHQLGAFAASSRLDGYAPILVKGPLKGGKATLSGEDSQPVSALLIAGAFVPLELHVLNPGEKPWIDLTLSWLDRFKIPYKHYNYEHYQMKGGASLNGFEYAVPGDFSSAAFPIAAALLTQSEITLEYLDMNDVQGDKEIIPALEKMGARFQIHPHSITVKKSPILKGERIDVNDFIDALPILAVIGCFAEGRTEIVNGAIARKKESDRIHAMATELKKMGAHIEELPDGLIIHRSHLRGANLETYKDHRIVMALAVAAMGASGPSTLHGIEAAAKTYPTFFSDLASLGANIDKINDENDITI